MIVGMRVARALGERRLPKFLFSTFPRPQEDPRKEEMTEQTDKDETSSKLNEIVGVMKDSANHLVARSQTLAHDPREQERVSFFQWMLEFTSRMPRQNWREFQKQAFTLACAYTPTDSPKATPRDHGYRRGLLPLHRKLITVNNTQWTPPQDQQLPLLVDSSSCCNHSLLKWWATFFWSFCKCFTIVVNRFCTTKCNVCKLSVKII